MIWWRSRNSNRLLKKHQCDKSNLTEMHCSAPVVNCLLMSLTQKKDKIYMELYRYALHTFNYVKIKTYLLSVRFCWRGPKCKSKHMLIGLTYQTSPICFFFLFPQSDHFQNKQLNASCFDSFYICSKTGSKYWDKFFPCKVRTFKVMQLIFLVELLFRLKLS